MADLFFSCSSYEHAQNIIRLCQKGFHKRTSIMCLTIINEVKDKLDIATAQLNSQVLMVAPSIADDLPFTFNTHDTLELLMDLLDLLESAKSQLDELQPLEDNPEAFSHIIDSCTPSVNVSTQTVTKTRTCAVGCLHADDMNSLSEAKTTMFDVNIQTESGKDDLLTSEVGLQTFLDNSQYQPDEGQKLEKEKDTSCLKEATSALICETAFEDKCCETETCTAISADVLDIHQVLHPSVNDVITQTDTVIVKKTDTVIVKSRAEQNEGDIQDSNDRTIVDQSVGEPTKEINEIDRDQSKVPKGTTNPQLSDSSRENTDSKVKVLEQFPIFSILQTPGVTKTESLEHPQDSQKDTLEPSMSKASTIKNRLKPSHKSRRAPDPPKSEVFKRQLQLRESNKPATNQSWPQFITNQISGVVFKSTENKDTKYPDNLNPFRDDD